MLGQHQLFHTQAGQLPSSRQVDLLQQELRNRVAGAEPSTAMDRVSGFYESFAGWRRASECRLSPYLAGFSCVKITIALSLRPRRDPPQKVSFDLISPIAHVEPARLPHQARMRRVIQEAMFGGRPCAPAAVSGTRSGFWSGGSQKSGCFCVYGF